MNNLMDLVFLAPDHYLSNTKVLRKYLAYMADNPA
jgi:hypothetical protein